MTAIGYVLPDIKGIIGYGITTFFRNGRLRRVLRGLDILIINEVIAADAAVIGDGNDDSDIACWHASAILR